MIRRLSFILLVAFASLWTVHAAKTESPADAAARPEAIFTPQPIYRPEWARQGLTGKGVVLVTIDQGTGKVAGARMLESTGNSLLDGAAVQAYSQWRFKPGSSVSQVKMPIEFTNRPAPGRAPRPGGARPGILYPVLILVGLAVAMMVTRRRQMSG